MHLESSNAVIHRNGQHRIFTALARRRVVVLSVLFMLLAIPLQAAPLLTVDGQNFHQSLTGYIDYYEDESNTLTFNDIRSTAYINQFAPPAENNIKLGFGHSSFWIRFALNNRNTKPRHLWLDITPPGIKQIKLFRSDLPQALETTGTNIPIRFRSIPQHDLVLPIEIPPRGTYTYYLQVKSDSPIILKMNLYSPELFSAKSTANSNASGAAYGALILFSLINFIFAVIFRESAYTFYGAYLFSIVFLQCIINGILQPWIPSISEWQSTIIYTLVCLGNCLLLLFITQLLAYEKLQDKWRRLINLVIYLNLAAIVSLAFVNPTLSYWLIFFATLFTALIAFVAPLYCYIVSQRQFYLIVAAARIWPIFIFITSVYALTSALAEFNISRIWVLFISIAEALLITIAMLVNSLRQSQRNSYQQQLITAADAEARAQTEILNRISHDIRTPMSGVIGMSELLLDTPLTPTQRDHVETIQSSGQALLNLISEIHDRAKMDSGRMKIESMPFDLAILVNECIDGYRSEAEEKNIELISHIHADVPVMVVGDATRLRQILLHLLGNAFKYTEQGEVVLTVATDQQRGEHNITFIVSDTGKGISATDQKLVFEPELKNGEKHFKLGLGLAIAKQLIDKMRGTIGVESELGKGSRFWISVPLPAQLITKEIELDIEKGMRDKRMLVVDDNQTCRKVIQQQAHSWGMQVATAHSGNEALAMIRAKSNVDEPFEIIIVDYDMPGMNGLQLAQKITDEFTPQALPLVIMLTGLSNAPSTASARDAGIRRVLTKPVTGKALKITIAEEFNYLNTQPENQHAYELKKNRSTTPTALEPSDSSQVLVAEDNPVSQKVIVSMLRKLGVLCKTVSNGAQAVESLKLHNYKLVLMDCEMPVMDGFEATRKIREWEVENAHLSTPIIALTAHIMDEHKEQSLAAGMNGHLAKPVEISQLQSTLKRWGLLLSDE